MNVGVFLRRRVLGHDVAYAEPLLTDFNPARVMSTLCRVHGHELLKDGLFNGDPSAARRPLVSRARRRRGASMAWRGARENVSRAPRRRAGTPGIFYSYEMGGSVVLIMGR